MHDAEKKLIALTKRPHLNQRERQHAPNVFGHLQTFLDALGNPEQKIPHYIHVTGTSGKGSTAAFIASILQADKRRVGLTVSPHLSTVYERWQINSTPISTRDFNRVYKHLARAFAVCAKANPAFGLSFFELCTALALTYFADQKVTWAVLEVFNGGRVDPTNIIPHKDAAVITSIGLDHEHLLGRTTSQIAREKAGIITSKTLVFGGEMALNTKKIIRAIAQKNQARLIFASAHQVYSLRVLGAHQQRNASLAAAVTRALGVSEARIKQGLWATTLPLRVEVIRRNPWLILDGAHNPQKIAATVAAVQALHLPQMSLVVSFSAHKNFKAMARALRALNPVAIYLTNLPPDQPTGDLKAVAQAFGQRAPVHIIPNPRQALRQATRTGNTLVTGSLYLATYLKKGL